MGITTRGLSLRKQTGVGSPDAESIFRVYLFIYLFLFFIQKYAFLSIVWFKFLLKTHQHTF